MTSLPRLQKNDTVEIIAPASRCTKKQFQQILELFDEWGLKYIFAPDMFGDDLLCANTDEYRVNAFNKAAHNPDTQAILCARGGYGCTRIIPKITSTKPTHTKLVIGISDMTALHLFIQKQWGWPSLHAGILKERFSPESLHAIKRVLFAENDVFTLPGIAMNAAANKNHILKSTIVGGNLALIQTSLGTSWQIDAKNKIILLEEVGERGYRIDRMLEHLRQANIFTEATAIILGDFIKGQEVDGSSLITPVLERFANSCNIPVIKISGIGHGYRSYPIPLGTTIELHLGEKIQLNWQR